MLKTRLIIFLFFITILNSSSIIAQQTLIPDSEIDNFSKNGGERLVLHGNRIYELFYGKPIAAFEPGGSKEKLLNEFISEQKVAGLLILQDGKIRLERYSPGHNESKLWSSLSVAKSVTSTLLGIAIKDGFIKSLNDYVTDYLPDLKGSAYDSVKIIHLLTMTAGIKWNEDYTDPNSDIAKFSTDSIENGLNATVSYMKRLPAVEKPGKQFLYSTGETHLLGALISAATHKSLSEYLSEKIWKPFGMKQDATWRLDRTGLEMAGCCLQMTLRDFGRFGEFILEDGYIDRKSILPENWLNDATKIQVPLWPGGGYGYGWWKFDGKSFDALGIHGQRIHIDPTRRMVIALNSEWPEADSNERLLAFTRFLNSIYSEIDKEQKN